MISPLTTSPAALSSTHQTPAPASNYTLYVSLLLNRLHSLLPNDRVEKASLLRFIMQPRPDQLTLCSYFWTERLFFADCIHVLEGTDYYEVCKYGRFGESTLFRSVALKTIYQHQRIKLADIWSWGTSVLQVGVWQWALSPVLDCWCTWYAG